MFGWCKFVVQQWNLSSWTILWTLAKSRDQILAERIYYYYYYYYYYSIKSSRADSRVKVWKIPKVSGTDCVRICRVMLMAGKTKTDDLVTCYVYCILGHQFMRFDFTSHQHRPEDGDAVSPWNLGELPHLDTAVCAITFYWILSRRKFKTLFLLIVVVVLVVLLLLVVMVMVVVVAEAAAAVVVTSTAAVVVVVVMYSVLDWKGDRFFRMCVRMITKSTYWAEVTSGEFLSLVGKVVDVHILLFLRRANWVTSLSFLLFV